MGWFDAWIKRLIKQVAAGKTGKSNLSLIFVAYGTPISPEKP
ncbi:hypothetical protein [Porphyromonas sp.]|nr:hypothetical protein [Porphyromonas sp.]